MFTILPTLMRAPVPGCPILKQLLLFVVLFTSIMLARANTFTVTSVADGGPGTLREALTLAAANGVATKDIILFNLPGTTIADHSILISNPIALSGNLVIDGTSQTSGPFGVSDARVIIQPATPMCYGFYATDIGDLEIYGLWFKGFQYIQNLTDVCHGEAILLNGIHNLTVGATGKGNAFSSSNGTCGAIFHKNYYGIDFQHANAFATGVRIEDNVFGLNDAADGIAPNSRETVFLGNGQDVYINNNKGSADFTVGSNAVTGNGFLKFTNNNLSDPFNSGGTTFGFFSVESQGVDRTSCEYDLTIDNNKISNNIQCCIILWDMTGSIKVTNNRLGEYFDMKDLPDDNFCLGMIRCKTTHPVQVIGNTIMNRREGIWTAGCGRVFINNNSIWCTKKGISIQQPMYPVPIAKINTITPTSLSGTTSPNVQVQVFYTDECTSLCENGKVLEGNAYSDASGVFSFPISHGGTYSVTSTTVDSITSEFNGVKVNLAYAQVKNATCGLNNGTVKGIEIINATSWHWEDETGNMVGSDTDLLNVGAGKYRMIAYEENVSCPLITDYFEVQAFAKPSVDPSSIYLSQPTCGSANGKIKLTVSRPPGAGIKWYNEAGDFIQSWGDSITNVLPGKYFCKLYLWEDTTCFSLYGPFTLVNQSGPSLLTGSVQITSSTCNLNNGAIKGMSASNTIGTATIRWIDTLNKVVGQSFDLNNVAAGRYRLQLTDGSGCSALISSEYVVPAMGVISLDDKGAVISAAKCSGEGGSIENILVSGADNFTWTNSSNGSVVGNSLPVSGLAAGMYQLKATNAIGCSTTSSVITVPQSAFQPLKVVALGSKAANCGKANGVIQVERFDRDTSIYTFRWIDSTSQKTVSNSSYVSDIYGGTYSLFAKDTNGCELKLITTSITDLPMPSFDYTKLNVRADQCSAGQGAITGVTVNDTRGSAKYVWLNANLDSIGNTLDMQHLAQDTYHLTVTDGIGCSISSNPVTVNNVDAALSKPLYDDQTIIVNTSATLSVKNAQAGTYELLDAPQSIPMQTNRTGIFTTPKLSSDKTFYVRLTNGSCTSEIAAVNVKIVDKQAVYVPTAFSPNNDGKNDIIRPIVLGIVKKFQFTIYNRWGQLIFQVSEIGKGWDGKIAGVLQDPNVFIWTCIYQFEDGEQRMERGTFTLLR